MERLHRGFRKAESQLISVVEDRKGEVKVCQRRMRGMWGGFQEFAYHLICIALPVINKNVTYVTDISCCP